MLKALLKEKQEIIEQGLERYLPPETPSFPQIHSAMRYSIFAGGKRLRPILALLACEVCGGTEEEVLAAACSLEMIHTYSLIHDDLPAMDDDDFRRGKPSNHKQFGEAMAILAGDALLTLAFQVISKETPNKERVSALVQELAEASGSQGMVGGQVLDMLAEGQSYDQNHLEQIHLAKTAALITAATRMGAIAAGASPEETEQLGRYGKHLGLAFQIKDDILDIEGSLAELGKTPCKDQAQEKMTYPGLMGIEEAKKLAIAQRDAAIEAVSSLPKTEALVELAHYVIERKS